MGSKEPATHQCCPQASPDISRKSQKSPQERWEGVAETQEGLDTVEIGEIGTGWTPWRICRHRATLQILRQERMWKSSDSSPNWEKELRLSLVSVEKPRSPGLE